MRNFFSLLLLIALLAACAAPTAAPVTPPTVIPFTALPPTQPPTAPPSATSDPGLAQPQAPAAATSPAEASPTVPVPSDTPPPSPTAVTPPPRTIILIIVDTLRADHVTSYGYGRDTTALSLDSQVAQKGVRFANVTSTAPWTCPSVAAMLTGRTPTSLGTTWLTLRDSVPKRADTLAESLQDAGYTTAGFTSTYCTKARLGVSQGFDHFDDSLTDRPTSNKARAAEINDLAMGWLEQEWLPRDAGKPLFLFLYYFDPHAWYDPLPPFDKKYDPDYTGALTPADFMDGENVVAGTLTLDERDREHLLALYDGEIAYWDLYLGQMLDYLQGRGLMDNALLVVTSDHGEFFGEHALWAHGNALYEEVIRVPMLMRYDGVIPAGLVVEAPVQNFDLMPTLLDWAGAPLPGDVQATSLRQVASGASGDPQRPVYSEVDALLDQGNVLYWTAPRLSLRSVTQNGWKLIHALEQAGVDELYQLQPASIYEIENLAQNNPGQAQGLLAALSAWFGLR
jgi:arylsulfatase